MGTLQLTTPRVSDRHLVFGYRYDNDDAEARFVRCLVSDRFGLSGDRALDLRDNPGALPSAELAYVTWASPGHAAVLHGRAPSLAITMQSVTPHAIRVPPGGSFRTHVRLPLPLVEWHGHLAPSRSSTDADDVHRITMVLELVPEPDVVEARTHPRLSEALWVHDAGSERLTAEIELPHRVPLLRRRDEIARIDWSGR